jgi:EAL domain-containing protein (putative c-di-GMP-specific phosphodiesterase class I)
VAVGVPGATTSEELVAHADMAMKKAKSVGGNGAFLFDDAVLARFPGAADIEPQLQSAISDGAFRLFFQPEYDLRTDRLLSVEALIRWQHPTLGLLTPSRFMEAAEDSNVIVDIGRWVLREACFQLASWRHDFPQLDLVVRVNVSPKQLASSDFVTMVDDMLATFSLPAASLCLEITEHGIMEHLDHVKSVLHEVRRLGVTVAIDDFGIGSSSLGHLKTLPVDALKIDRRFVLELGMNPGDRAIVESIVAMAHTFHLDVVAEGVQTSVAAAELLQLGCHRVQGHLFDRPMTSAAFRELLRQPRPKVVTQAA